MFQDFSHRAIKVIMLAQQESRLMKHDLVGVETIFLGLILEETGVAAKLLKLKGVSLSAARTAVKHLTGLGCDGSFKERSFTPRAFHVLQLAVDECRQDKHKHSVDTEHLLLSLIREEENISEDAISTEAFKILQNLGIELSMLRDQVINIILQPERKTITESSLAPQLLTQSDSDILTKVAELAEGLSPAAKQQLAIKLLVQNQNLL